MTTFRSPEVEAAVRGVDNFYPWVERHPSFETAWDSCDHGNWMLEFLVLLYPSSREPLLVAIKSARRVLSFVGESNSLFIEGLGVAEGWVRRAYHDRYLDYFLNRALIATSEIESRPWRTRSALQAVVRAMSKDPVGSLEASGWAADTAELELQRKDIRELYMSLLVKEALAKDPPKIPTRFEREPVI